MPASKLLYNVGEFYFDEAFAAASLAVIVSSLSWLFTHLQLKANGARTDFTSRTTLATTNLESKNLFVKNVGVSILRGLAASKWAQENHKIMIASVPEEFEDLDKGFW